MLNLRDSSSFNGRRGRPSTAHQGHDQGSAGSLSSVNTSPLWWIYSVVVFSDNFVKLRGDARLIKRECVTILT